MVAVTGTEGLPMSDTTTDTGRSGRDDVDAVVVTGAGGKAFVSGADISKFESERASLDLQLRQVSGSSSSGLGSRPATRSAMYLATMRPCRLATWPALG